MANLTVAGRRVKNKKTNYKWVKQKTDNYMNRNATKNVLHYITRTRKYERRKDELVAWGSINVACGGDIEVGIEKFEKIHKRFKRKKKRSAVRHEIMHISERDFMYLEEDFDKVEMIAREWSKIYDQMGYQVIYAIHDPREKKKNQRIKNIHIHFVINATGYRGGKRFSETKKEFRDRRESCGEFVKGYYGRGVKPIYFDEENAIENIKYSNNTKEVREVETINVNTCDERNCYKRIVSPIIWNCPVESPITFGCQQDEYECISPIIFNAPPEKVLFFEPINNTKEVREVETINVNTCDERNCYKRIVSPIIWNCPVESPITFGCQQDEYECISPIIFNAPPEKVLFLSQ